MYRIAFSADFPSAAYEVRLEKIGRTTSGATGFAPFAAVPVVQAIAAGQVDVALAYISDGTYVNLESPGIPGGTYLVLSFAAYA